MQDIHPLDKMKLRQEAIDEHRLKVIHLMAENTYYHVLKTSARKYAVIVHSGMHYGTSDFYSMPSIEFEIVKDKLDAVSAYKLADENNSILLEKYEALKEELKGKLAAIGYPHGR